MHFGYAEKACASKRIPRGDSQRRVHDSGDSGVLQLGHAVRTAPTGVLCMSAIKGDAACIDELESCQRLELATYTPYEPA